MAEYKGQPFYFLFVSDPFFTYVFTATSVSTYIYECRHTGRSQGDPRHTYAFYNVIKPQRSLMKQYSTHYSSEVAVKHTFLQ